MDVVRGNAVIHYYHEASVVSRRDVPGFAQMQAVESPCALRIRIVNRQSVGAA